MEADKTQEEKKDPVKSNDDEARQRIRIKIRAYDHKIVDQSARTIIDTVERSGSVFSGPVPLPTEKRKYTVQKSSFVHKDARDQYEMRVHKRLIDIFEPNAKTVDSLQNLNLPAGVDVEIKM
jgi:small subunit ribosomal protein S10